MGLRWPKALARPISGVLARNGVITSGCFHYWAGMAAGLAACPQRSGKVVEVDDECKR